MCNDCRVQTHNILVKLLFSYWTLVNSGERLPQPGATRSLCMCSQGWCSALGGATALLFDCRLALLGIVYGGLKKGSVHYASQQAATRLPRVFTTTLRLPPPIFCCNSRYLTLLNMLKFPTARAQGLCEWRETQCVAAIVAIGATLLLLNGSRSTVLRLIS